jgi:hypothetical protein
MSNYQPYRPYRLYAVEPFYAAESDAEAAAATPEIEFTAANGDFYAAVNGDLYAAPEAA